MRAGFIGAEQADFECARIWLEAIANYGILAAIIDVGLDMGFDRQQFLDAFMAGSAQSFAVGVGPQMVLPRTVPGTLGSFAGLHDLLEKDVDHCRDLQVQETQAPTSLIASCDFMMEGNRRAAAESGWNIEDGGQK